MHGAIKRISDRMKSPHPVRWVFTGDSITHGVVHTWGWRDYVELFSERLRCELGRTRDIVIKTAVAGWTTEMIRSDIDWNILQFDPDVVSIMIGMNDAVQGQEGLSRFRDNYQCILDRIQEKKTAHVLLHTPNPIWPETKTQREHLADYAEQIRQLASERDLPLIDHWAYWTQAIQENFLRQTGWMGDAIHPDQHGHRAFAHLLLKELDLWDPASNVCRLFVP